MGSGWNKNVKLWLMYNNNNKQTLFLVKGYIINTLSADVSCWGTTEFYADEIKLYYCELE